MVLHATPGSRPRQLCTRPCHKYRFQFRIRCIQIVEFEYEFWPPISSCVPIRDIPGKHGYESTPKLIDLDQLPTFSSAKHLLFPSMSDRFRHVSHPVFCAVNGSRETSNGRPLASTPRFRQSTPTRTAVGLKSSPNIKWYLADVKRHKCIRMARSSVFNSAAGQNLFIPTATYSSFDLGVGAIRLAAYGYGSSDTHTCQNTYPQYTYGRACCARGTPHGSDERPPPTDTDGRPPATQRRAAATHTTDGPLPRTQPKGGRRARHRRAAASHSNDGRLPPHTNDGLPTHEKRARATRFDSCVAWAAAQRLSVSHNAMRGRGTGRYGCQRGTDRRG